MLLSAVLKGFCGCGPKLDKDLTAVEEIRLVIFTMFSHRKVQTVSVFIISGFVYCSIFVYQITSYHLLDLGLGIDRFHCHATKKYIGNRPVEEAKKMKCYKRLIYKQFSKSQVFVAHSF